MIPGREASTTGLDAHVAAALAYVAGPISGALVLLAEEGSTYVRFHAWQSVLGLGGLGLIVVFLQALTFGSIVVSAAAFDALKVTSWLAAAAWIVCWVLCLVKAFTRRRWTLHIAGAYAERLSATREIPQ
jgi:uncharacterized membrane protein